MAWTFYKADGSALTAVGTAATAEVATAVTVTDNESTDENNVLTFVANADADGGDVGLESDGNLHYNPSTGMLSATAITITGELNAGSLDISGDADIDGTLETDALTVGGTNVLTGSLITTLGTVSAGVWNGTALGLAYIDIDGGTDIGEAIVDADLMIIDNGAGGTNRKTAASRLKTYIGGPTEASQTNMEGEATGTIYAPPDLIKHSPGVAKAWCQIVGTTGTPILGSPSPGVGSVVDDGVGRYDIVWSTAFSTSIYATPGVCSESNGGNFISFGGGGGQQTSRSEIGILGDFAGGDQDANVEITAYGDL